MSELRAVTIDLDDTLFAQADWLAGAWKAVARTGIAFGIDPVAFDQLSDPRVDIGKTALQRNPRRSFDHSGRECSQL